jgi:hypothetical protein
MGVREGWNRGLGEKAEYSAAFSTTPASNATAGG